MKQFILFTISILTSTVLYAGDYDDERVISKSYAIEEDFEIQIERKHSDINLTTWDKDCVAVNVIIYASSSNEIKMNELIHEVDVRFNKSQNYLGLQTVWGSTSSSILKDIKNLFGDHVISLSYNISLPAYVELDIKNKFGNITIDKIEGDIKLENNHGNIVIQEMKDAKSIDIAYGKLKVKKGEELDITSKFSDITLDIIEEVELSSTSSEIEIEEVQKLKIKSLSDELEIEEAEEVTINSNLSEIEINSLSDKLNVTMRMGSLEVESIHAKTKEIIINGQFTDIELNFEESSSYKYDVSLEKGKSFLIPTQGNTLIEDNYIGEVHEYIGHFNENEGTLVKIITKQSYIRLGTE